MCDSKSAIFHLLSSFFLHYDFCSSNDNSKTVQALTLILVRNRCSSQHAASQPLSVFTLVNKSHSQHSVVAVCCEGRHCSHAHTKSHFQPNTTLIGLGTTLVHKGNKLRARLARSLPVVVGKVCEHHIGKALNSAANL